MRDGPEVLRLYEAVKVHPFPDAIEVKYRRLADCLVHGLRREVGKGEPALPGLAGLHGQLPVRLALGPEDHFMYFHGLDNELPAQELTEVHRKEDWPCFKQVLPCIVRICHLQSLKLDTDGNK